MTPDLGLLFWMVVIFGIVFFLLAKFGFPIITRSVDERNAKIQQSLKDADELQLRMAQWTQEHSRMLEETRKEQSAILKEATEAKSRILADAQAQAQAQADRILEKARIEITLEKESAMRDVRREIGLLGVQMAEKVLREELSDESRQKALLDQLIDEAHNAEIRS